MRRVLGSTGVQPEAQRALVVCTQPAVSEESGFQAGLSDFKPVASTVAPHSSSSASWAWVGSTFGTTKVELILHDHSLVDRGLSVLCSDLTSNGEFFAFWGCILILGCLCFYWTKSTISLLPHIVSLFVFWNCLFACNTFSCHCLWSELLINPQNLDQISTYVCIFVRFSRAVVSPPFLSYGILCLFMFSPLLHFLV